ncbi:MAG: hypothetical protein ABJB98_03805 [Actinomycetota bacterium]
MSVWPASPGVRVGLALFGIGVGCILIDVLPFFAGSHDRPLWLNLACLAAPAGLLIALGAVVRAGRAAQRRALDQVEYRR